MGLYINPRGESKESFLRREGKPLPGAPTWPYPSGQVAVCLVDNGGFTAAGIANSERELLRFMRGMSGRPHRWYMVPMAKVQEANAY